MYSRGYDHLSNIWMHKVKWMNPNYSKNEGIRQIKSFDDFDTYQCIECNGKPAYPNSMKSNEWEYQKPYLTKYEWGKREYIRCGFCNSSSFKIKNPLEKIFEWKGLIKDTINDDDESHVYRLNDTDFRIEVILPASVHKEWNYNPHYMHRDILFMFRSYASGEGRSTSIRTKCPRCNHKINTNIPSKIHSEILCPNCKTSVDPIAIIHTCIQEIIKSNVELRRWAERMQESRYQEEGSRFFILDVQEKPVESEVAAKTVKTPKNRWEALEI